jgi:hypothetical protein
MRPRFVPLAGVVAMLVSPAAAPHHSLALYSNEAIELEGEVLDFAWQNPHVELVLRTIDADGKEQTWRTVGGSPTTMQRSGVTRDLVRVGDHVKVAGRASRSEPFLMSVSNVLLADGREAQFLTGAPQHFKNAEYVRGTDRVVSARQENRGIFRVWSVPAPNPVTPILQKLPYRAEAVAARASFDLANNFATRCEPEGMPRIMFNPHPFEFVDHGATITLRAELYDIERTIHMNGEAPANETNSRLGYSVGRWDGGALVVTTTHVDWPYFDNAGTPQSTAVRIVERFAVSDDQATLSFRVTVTDPATFTEPAAIDGRWTARGDTIGRYDCRASR